MRNLIFLMKEIIKDIKNGEVPSMVCDDTWKIQITKIKQGE